MIGRRAARCGIFKTRLAGGQIAAMADDIRKSDGGETKPATIDSTFRNGSLTAIGVVVGFSLGFLSRWASTPGEWTRPDLVAVTAITLGIALQIKALAELLSRQSLAVHRYDRAVRIFLTGLILVAVGVVLAIFAEVIGLGGNIF
jgi:hypothetical protein